MNKIMLKSHLRGCFALSSLLLLVNGAVAAEQFLYLTLASEMQIYAPSGELTAAFPFAASDDTAVDSHGNIYASVRSSNVVLKYPAGSQQPEAFAQPSGVGANGMLITDSEELLIGVDQLRPMHSGVSRYGLDGTELGEFAEVPLAAEGFVADMKFDTDGNLYVAYGSKVHKFDPSGQWLTVFTESPSSFPVDIAFDSDGNFYMATNDSEVYKSDAEGSLISTFDIPYRFFSMGIDDNDIIHIGGRRDFSSGFVDQYDSNGNFVGNLIPNTPDDVLDILFVPVPEPSSFLLLKSTVCLGGLIRKRRSSGSS